MMVMSYIPLLFGAFIYFYSLVGTASTSYQGCYSENNGSDDKELLCLKDCFEEGEVGCGEQYLQRLGSSDGHVKPDII